MKSDKPEFRESLGLKLLVNGDIGLKQANSLWTI